MFNFFKRKQDKQQDTELDVNDTSLAAITYFINKDSNAAIDISLKDYEADSIEALCKLLDVLSTDAFYVETINMIKNGLTKDDQEEVLIRIFTHISQQVRNKILTTSKESTMDTPCIKPSDMLH